MAAPTLPQTYNAFFYGTLMAPEVLYRVLYDNSKVTDPSKLKTIVPAILPDYCRHKVKYADYPGIVAEAGHTVRGTYVTGLTHANMRNLDLFEGPQYAREKVTVKILAPKTPQGIMGEAVETGELKEAETYVFLDKDDLVKEEWDYEYFRREKMRNWADIGNE